MVKYLINKRFAGNQIVIMEFDIKGYRFNPKKTKKYIDVDNVIFYDKEMIDSILTAKFNKSFRKILALTKIIINDEDATEDTARLCLDEAELLRQLLLYKYQDFIDKEKLELFLNRIKMIEQELRIKQIYIKEKAIYLERAEIESKSRGR